MNSMKTPRTRAEFERNFHLMHQLIKDGRFHVGSELHIIDSLTRVRYLPNGRIDFLSVDESARLQANMTAQFDQETFKEHLLGKPKEEETESESADKPKA